MVMGRTALVMLSGGPDSFAAGAWATNSYDRVEAIFLDAGQVVADAERQHARAHARRLGVSLFELDVRSLVSNMQALGATGKSIFKGAGLPLLAFSCEIALSIGFSACAARDLQHLVLGLHGDDADHPDYTRRALDLMTTVGDRPVQPVALTLPFRGQSKTCVFAYGLEHGLPLHESWSCTDNVVAPCGVCTPCRQRASAFDANRTIAHAAA